MKLTRFSHCHCRRTTTDFLVHFGYTSKKRGISLVSDTRLSVELGNNINPLERRCDSLNCLQQCNKQYMLMIFRRVFSVFVADVA